MIGVRQPPARKLPSLAAALHVRALEVLVFHTQRPRLLSRPRWGLDQRTARRLLFTLEDEGYLQRGHARTASAGRLPLVQTGDRNEKHIVGRYFAPEREGVRRRSIAHRAATAGTRPTQTSSRGP